MLLISVDTFGKLVICACVSYLLCQCSAVRKHITPASCFSPQSLDPSKRIGCEEMGGYDPLKQHPFFDTISWSDLHLQTPPKLTPYLPAMSEDDEDCYGNVIYFLSHLTMCRLIAHSYADLGVMLCSNTAISPKP